MAAISWFLWKSEQAASLAQISPTYRLRYSHEHGYRFDKQELLWDLPRLSEPNAGRGWLPVCTISWSWFARRSRAAIDRGKLVAQSDLGAGTTSHADPFARVGNTGLTTATARKSTRTGQRLSSQAQDTASCDL